MRTFTLSVTLAIILSLWAGHAIRPKGEDPNVPAFEHERFCPDSHWEDDPGAIGYPDSTDQWVY